MSPFRTSRATRGTGIARPAAAPSSLARELQFLTSHTIHHFAVIALILRAMDVEVDREFGVAPSTLRYWTEAADLVR